MRRPVASRAWRWLVACAVPVVLAACGGGGDSSSSSSGSGGTVPAAATNTVAVTVDAGPTGKFVNVITTSVTICVPGGSSCQTIPDVLVDTGSTGLRLLASTVTLALPGVPSPGGTYHECADFADGTLWGGVALVDLQMGGEKAASLPVQVIQDGPGGPAVPASCSNKGAPENSLAQLGANGILGIGFFLHDCGAYCTTTPDAIYFDCDVAGNCGVATIPLAMQLAQPVSLFAQDRNGTVLQLGAVPDNGALSVAGTLTFGIGTQANNTLAGTPIAVPASGSTAGYFTASYLGATLANGIIDSGSSATFFADPSLPACATGGVAPGFYCPGSAAALSATPFTVALTGSNGAGATVTGSVANAEFLFKQPGPPLNVFSNVAGPTGATLSGAFDLGVPFFLGKRVYTAIEGAATSGGTGPYVAFAAGS